MEAIAWLNLVMDEVRGVLPAAYVSRPEDELLTLSLGTRSALVHVVDGMAILAPSFSAGGTIGSRLHNRVQHLEMTSYL